MKGMKLAIMAALVGLCGVAQGQGGRQLRLSLDEAQAYALEHNAAMKNADLDMKKAE